MSQRMSLSRAARLVGVKRGTLQKQIRQGELPSFDGEIEVEGLLKLYPDAQLEDSAMLEKMERIMEDAVCKPNEPEVKKTLVSSLAARVAYMGRDLADARKSLDDYEALHSQFLAELQELDGGDHESLVALVDWFSEQSAEIKNQVVQSSDDGFLLNDSLLKFMTAHVRLLPSGHDFFVEGSETILEAGLRSGLNVNYGCNNGTCGKCKARVVSGEVQRVKPHDYVLSEQEKTHRYILTCCNSALTDVVLDAEETDEASAIPHQEISAKIKAVTYPDDHIMALRVRTPRTERFRALGGQFAKISLGDIDPVLLAIASCPCDESNMDFHIHEQKHPQLWEAVKQARQTSRVTVQGPYGEFVLRTDSNRSCVFIAFGAGFGAIKSLVEHAMALDEAEQLIILWFGGSQDGGVYMKNLCRSWNDALDNVAFKAIESDQDGYPDLIETLQSLFVENDDYREMNYYVAGEGGEVTTTRTVLVNSKVPAGRVATTQV